MQKTSVFRFWCLLRFADFLFFSIPFSAFAENNSGFSVSLSNVVFEFSYFESKWGFRFWPNFLAVLRFWTIFSNSSVLRFLIYPNVELVLRFLQTKKVNHSIAFLISNLKFLFGPINYIHDVYYSRYFKFCKLRLNLVLWTIWN